MTATALPHIDVIDYPATAMVQNKATVSTKGKKIWYSPVFSVVHMGIELAPHVGSVAFFDLRGAQSHARHFTAVSRTHTYIKPAPVIGAKTTPEEIMVEVAMAEIVAAVETTCVCSNTMFGSHYYHSPHGSTREIQGSDGMCRRSTTQRGTEMPMGNATGCLMATNFWCGWQFCIGPAIHRAFCPRRSGG